MDKSNSGQVKWTNLASKELEKDAGPKYSRFSESIRHLTPGTVQCSMFCGGRQCKYENPSKMKDEDMAIKGLYSTWITDNIMAMARPSTEIMKTYSVIEQFTKAGINSVMNLQRSGEHASCGYGLMEESGFSYVPENFMQADIFFYNFGWNDYGVRSLESILDMVKVMSFALQEGKAAVHCHAGLGRTGVLISCFFVFSERLKADEAIHKMRSKRPKAVQTRGQIECVNDFANFVSQLWVVFATGQQDAKTFTLQQYLIRQKRLLHGFESRHLKHIPKIVYSVCLRLLELGNIKTEDPSYPWSLSEDIKNMFTEGDERSPDSSVTEQDTESSNRNAGDSSNRALSRSCSVEGVNDGTRTATLNSSADDLAVKASNRQRRLSDSELNLQKGYETDREQPSLLKRFSDIRIKDDSYSSTCENGCTTVCARPSSSEAGSSACSQSADERIQVARTLAASACADAGVQNRTERLKRKLNSSNSCWEELKTESDPWVLTRLLWAWLEHLSEPVMRSDDVELVASSELEPLSALKKLNQGTRKTVECLVTTIYQLGPLPEEVSDRVLRRVAMVLTHNRVLPLTFPRASLDTLGETVRLSLQPQPQADQPQATSQLEEQENELETSGSVASSPSYRLLMFLRRLMTAVRKQISNR